MNHLDKIGLAEGVKTPVDMLLKLAKDKHEEIRWRVARNPTTPPEAIDWLAHDLQVIQHWALRNPNCPAKTLVEMSNNKDCFIRSNVPANLNTPIEILVKLADDEMISIRYGVAFHPRTPVKTLMKLTDDEDSYVRTGIAQNVNASAEVLIKLAEDTSWVVQKAVPENPNCPEAVKLWLKMGGYAGLSLAEFIEKVNNE